LCFISMKNANIVKGGLVYIHLSLNK
jgi:hypothetical protein